VAVKNLNEGVVTREYDRLLPTVPGFCGCEVCRDDVMVYALNRIAPHFVTERLGTVIQHIALQRDQSVADVAVALLEGFRVVMASPRPECEKAGGRSEG
jgi:competence protein ComFB